MKQFVLAAILLAAIPAMAQTSIGPTFVGAPPIHLSSTNTWATLNGADDFVGCFIQIPVTDTLEAVAYKLGTVTTADDVSVNVYTVGTDGLRTGTNYASSSAGTTAAAALTSAGTEEAVMNVTCTAGDLVAIVFSLDYVDGTINIATATNTSGSSWRGAPITFTALNGGADTFTGAHVPMLALKFTTAGWVVPVGCVPPCTISSLAIQSDTTPDEVAFQYTPPFACRLAGVYMVAPTDAGTTALTTIDVFDDDGSSPTSMLSNPFEASHDWFGRATAGRPMFINLEPEDLDADEVANIGIFSADATNNFSVYYIDVDDAQYWGDFMPHIRWATRTDAGGFTESTTRKPLGGVIVTSITAGSGGLAVDPIITP